MNDTEKSSRTNTDTTTPRSFVPKLRKNKRLDNRWGLKYYAAVKEAVFASRTSPYMPSEPPLSLSKEVSEPQPLYVCKQCRDCFRFPASLEDHSTRRSWILGYWCQNCFSTDCSHVPNGESACSACQDLDRQKKCYLRAKGLKKGRKMGCIKIFYNQCQFFSHLKMHRTITVDMGDVMLMPIPTDIEAEQYVELDEACEILMEHMFLTRSHIMDWLKANQVGNKWWRLLHVNSENNNDKNPVAEILRVSREKRVREANDTATSLSLPLTPLNIVTGASAIDVSKSDNRNTDVIASKAVTSVNPLEPLEEDDDDPCVIAADIAFVDCGPTAKTYLSDHPTRGAGGERREGDSPRRSIIEGAKVMSANYGTGVGVASDSSTARAVVLSSSLTGVESSMVPSSTPVVYNVSSSNVMSPWNDSAFAPKISVRKFASERSASPPVTTSLWKNFSRVYSRKKQDSSRKTLDGRRIDVMSMASLSLVQKTNDGLIGTLRTNVGVDRCGPSTAATTKSNPTILAVHSSKDTNFSTIINQLPPDVVNGKKILFIEQDAEHVGVLPKHDIPSEHVKATKTVPLKMTTHSLMPNSNDSSSGGGSGSSEDGGSDNSSSSSNSCTANQHGAKSIRASTMQKLLTDPIGRKVEQVSVDGKIVYKNKQKFIIKHAATTSDTWSSTSVGAAINKLPVSITPRPLAEAFPLEDRVVSPPTPSPSPSEHSSCSSCETPSGGGDGPLSIVKRNAEKQAIGSSIASRVYESSNATFAPTYKRKGRVSPEYLSIETDDVTGRCYLVISSTRPTEKAGTTDNWYDLAPKYRQQMLDSLAHLNKIQLVKRINHLKSVNSEYSRELSVEGTDSIILENLEAIKLLEDAMKGGSRWNNEEYESEEEEENEDDGGGSVVMTTATTSNAREAEQELPLSPPPPPSQEKLLSSLKTFARCIRCDRPIRPRSYIVGLTRMPKDGTWSHCSCYEHVCHICNIFQGNESRLNAHLNYHAKKEPFTCPECCRQFSSFKLLDMHVWTSCFHPLIKRLFGCKICQVEGFLNMESVTRHFVIVHSERKIACDTCRVIMNSRAALTEHRKTEHPDASGSYEAIELTVCNPGQCVVRPERYRAHMNNHVGIFRMLYYKCPFCVYSAKESERGKEAIKCHLYRSHLERLSELIHLESLIEIMSIKQIKRVKAFRERNFLKYQDDENALFGNSRSIKPEKATETGMTIPKIVSARTITPELFERVNRGQQRRRQKQPDAKNVGVNEVTCDIIWSAINSTASVLPKILDVRSIASDDLHQTTPEKMERNDGWSDPIVEEREMPDATAGPSLIPIGAAQLTRMEMESRKSDKVGSRDSGTVASTTKQLWTSKVNLLQASDRKDASSSVGGAADLVEKEVKGGEEEEEEQKRKLDDIADVFYKARTNLPKISPIFEIWSTNSDRRYVKMNSVLRSPLPAPPPLARIPQHFLNVPAIGTREEKRGRDSSNRNATRREKYRGKDPSERNAARRERYRSKNALERNAARREKYRRNRNGPLRIALNGPISRIEEAQDFRCHLCAELISTAWPVVKSHFSSRHSRDYRLSILAPRLVRMSTEFIEGGYRMEEEAAAAAAAAAVTAVVVAATLGDGKKRKADLSTPMPKRRKRWTPKKYVDKTNLLAEAGFYVRQESAQDGEGNFRCKKCNVRCGNMAELRDHIATNHRIKGRYLICLECGENFVVAPSLQMHLKALHGITDPITYMTQNTAYAPEMMDDGENEARAAVANQCHVCMAVFEDKAAVDKHLRVHGMAFLNRKRIEAQNAVRKRPEKRDKLTEDQEKRERKGDDEMTETSTNLDKTRASAERTARSDDDNDNDGRVVLLRRNPDQR